MADQLHGLVAGRGRGRGPGLQVAVGHWGGVVDGVRGVVVVVARGRGAVARQAAGVPLGSQRT